MRICLKPDDIAAGHVMRFRRSSTDRVVRSRQAAHPAIVSIDTFTQDQLLRRSNRPADSAPNAKRSAAVVAP